MSNPMRQKLDALIKANQPPPRTPRTLRPVDGLPDLGLRAEAAPPEVLRLFEDPEPREEYQGKSLDPDYDDTRGGEGLRWRQGRLYREWRPDLLPFYARGRNGDAGAYERVALLPVCKRVLRAITQTLAAAPWTLERPKLPPWLEGDAQAEAALARQWRWAQYAWHKQTRAGNRYSLRQWIYHVLKHALTSGFYLGELRGEVEAVPGLEVPCFVPSLPAVRLPSSVYEWILRGEEPVAVQQELLQFTDSYGAQAPDRPVIPWSRLVHVAFEPEGETDLEGTSLFRAPYALCQIMTDTFQLQGLSQELDAVGTKYFTQATDSPASDPQINKLERFCEDYVAEVPPYAILPPGFSFQRDSGKTAVTDLGPIYGWLERAALMAMGGEHILIAVQGAGSYAAKQTGSADARDALDDFAALVCGAIEQHFAKAAALAFPGQPLYLPTASYAQVEEQDNGAYLDNVAKYVSIREQLSPAARQRLEALLDLPTEDTADQ